MDSFEFNKIAGAVLGTALAVLGLRELSAAIYHGEKPEKPGFAIEVTEAATGGEATGAAEAVPIGKLLASADPAKGAAAAKACVACHDLTKAGANKTGPGLWDVVERPIASHGGFAYSPDLKSKSAETWTYDSLDHFLKSPKSFAPKTKMTYAGIGNDGKRADVIAYLRSLSDAPKPLPAP